MDKNIELANCKTEHDKNNEDSLESSSKVLIDSRITEILRRDHVPSIYEINSLKAIGRNQGFPDKIT